MSIFLDNYSEFLKDLTHYPTTTTTNAIREIVKNESTGVAIRGFVIVPSNIRRSKLEKLNNWLAYKEVDLMLYYSKEITTITEEDVIEDSGKKYRVIFVRAGLDPSNGSHDHNVAYLSYIS